MTDEPVIRTSKERLIKSLWHFAGCLRSALKDSGAVDMRITSEDARDVQAAADELKRLDEIVRLQRMAIDVHKANAPETPVQPACDHWVHCPKCGEGLRIMKPAVKAAAPQCEYPGCHGEHATTVHIDWGQYRLNGGSYCMHVYPGETRYCGRAELWAGHSDDPRWPNHPFVPGCPSPENGSEQS